MNLMKSAAIAAAFAVLLGGSAEAQTYQVTLAGASPGGLWSTIGTGFDKALAKAYPGSTVTYQTAPAVSPMLSSSPTARCLWALPPTWNSPPPIAVPARSRGIP